MQSCRTVASGWSTIFGLAICGGVHCIGKEEWLPPLFPHVFPHLFSRPLLFDKPAPHWSELCWAATSLFKEIWSAADWEMRVITFTM